DTSADTEAETETEKKSSSSGSHSHSSSGSGKPSGSSSGSGSGSGSGSSNSHSSSHSGGESPSGSSSKSRKKSDSEDETDLEAQRWRESDRERETEAEWVEIDYEDYLEEQSAIDDALLAEAESGYSFEAPFIVVNPYKNSPLTAMVIFTTEEETAVEVVVCGRNGENNITTTFEADTTHILPIYGLSEGDTSEVVKPVDGWTSTTLEITTEALDTSLADAEVTVCEDAAWDVLEEGELTFAFIQSAQEGASGVVAYDNAGDIRWYMDEEYVSSFPMKRLANGRMMASTSDVISGYYYSTGLVEFDLCGKFYAIYLIPGGEHHDFVELENGNLLVCSCSEDFSMVEDRIVEIDRETGEVVYELNISDLIEPGDGASENATEDDWCHNNSIDYDEETDTILLSCRHLDAVLAINKTEKALVWILGDPTGFTSVSEDLFLTPVDEDGGFEWQYAQHNATFLPDGDILLFDNGTHRTKVGSEEDATTGDDVYSRAVRYHIDTEAMTVEQVWSYGEDRGAEWYSFYISGADYLAEDTYWVTSGSNSYSTELETYDLTVAQTTQGILTTYIDLVVGDELVYELTIPASTYRSMRASLYTEENTYSVEEEAVWYGSLGNVAQADADELLLDVDGETVSLESLIEAWETEDAAESEDGTETKALNKDGSGDAAQGEYSVGDAAQSEGSVGDAAQSEDSGRDGTHNQDRAGQESADDETSGEDGAGSADSAENEIDRASETSLEGESSGNRKSGGMSEGSVTSEDGSQSEGSDTSEDSSQSESSETSEDGSQSEGSETSEGASESETTGDTSESKDRKTPGSSSSSGSEDAGKSEDSSQSEDSGKSVTQYLAAVAESTGFTITEMVEMPDRVAISGTWTLTENSAGQEEDVAADSEDETSRAEASSNQAGEASAESGDSSAWADDSLVLLSESGDICRFTLETSTVSSSAAGQESFSLWLTADSVEAGHRYYIYLYREGVLYATHTYWNVYVDTRTSIDEQGAQYALYDVDGRSYTVLNADTLLDVADIETDLETELTMPEQTQAISDAIVAEVENNGYTFDNPLVIQNPYQNTPLTAVVAFATEEECEVRVTVKGKSEAQDITDIIDAASLHIVPVLGLYADYDNEVVLELLDADGNVTDTRTLTITTEALPSSLQGEVETDTYTTESSMGLMLVSGLSAPYAYAFDETGEIRWYCTVEWEYYGLFMLENGHFLIEAENVLYPNASMPNSSEFWEMDYLGRVYTVYYFPEGVHHDIQEMTPDGNFLILTNSNDGYEQNMIQEIDRETGEVVKSLNLNELFEGLEYIDSDDWCHTNTVSYDEETDSILISCRNLHSVTRIDWSTDEILWILADPTVWEGTGYEDLVLTATGDIQWQYQQHSAYALEEDLDGNPDTVEIILFDNHYSAHRKVSTYDYTGSSYVKIYSVDAENMTVTLLKNYETLYSVITSNAFYDSDTSRVFSVNAYLSAYLSVENRGQIYEIDYESGEILNSWKTTHRFYRGYAITLSMNDCAGAYTMSENSVRGTLRAPVEVSQEDAVSITENETISEDIVSFTLRGSVLYLEGSDHMYTQVIFNGEEHTYVYDITDIKSESDDVDSYRYEIPIPLNEMEADTYTIQIMYDDELYNVEGSITVS
ncbi:MAG: aryl-sulfate sulfotransferase, partial [Lachnospiraceae bacterium]|nr:aryl-sulfate sulfotransferase [Lachnospiraceae bacterium]